MTDGMNRVMSLTGNTALRTGPWRGWRERDAAHLESLINRLHPRPLDSLTNSAGTVFYGVRSQDLTGCGEGSKLRPGVCSDLGDSLSADRGNLLHGDETGFPIPSVARNQYARHALGTTPPRFSGRLPPSSAMVSVR